MRIMLTQQTSEGAEVVLTQEQVALLEDPLRNHPLGYAIGLALKQAAVPGRATRVRFSTAEIDALTLVVAQINEGTGH